MRACGSPDSVRSNSSNRNTGGCCILAKAANRCSNRHLHDVNAKTVSWLFRPASSLEMPRQRLRRACNSKLCSWGAVGNTPLPFSRSTFFLCLFERFLLATSPPRLLSNSATQNRAHPLVLSRGTLSFVCSTAPHLSVV